MTSLFFGSNTVFSQTETPQETSPKQKISAKSLKQGQVQTVESSELNSQNQSNDSLEVDQDENPASTISEVNMTKITVKTNSPTFFSMENKSSNEQSFIEPDSKSNEKISEERIKELLDQHRELKEKGLSTRDLEYELFSYGIRVVAIVEKVDDHNHEFILPINAEGKLVAVLSRISYSIPIAFVEQIQDSEYTVKFSEVPSEGQLNQFYRILGYQGYEFK